MSLRDKAIPVPALSEEAEILWDLLDSEHATEINTVPLHQIRYYTGWSYRKIKQIITELRMFIPVCSKETGDGGYWIASSAAEVKAFVVMIKNRRDGYDRTITRMENHIGDWDIE